MKLLSLVVSGFRCLRDVTISLSDLNIFIGPNASGKSSILDALRFLREGVQARDFEQPVFARGGMASLVWKGGDSRQINLRVEIADDDRRYQWSVSLRRDGDGHGFATREELVALQVGMPSEPLLSADRGKGWWWSGETRQQIPLAQSGTACALSAAAADATFPARAIADFVRGWGFFDPSPFMLRIGSTGPASARLDEHGGNLAARLHELSQSSPTAFNQIVASTQSILGLPAKIEVVEYPPGRFWFVQDEPGLHSAVHQFGASSGTLRMMALMTALFGEAEGELVGIEEPENHVHPAAIAALAESLLMAKQRVQILVTTHSPLLLDFINEPGAVCVVRRDTESGTQVARETNPEGAREALAESGFRLGEFYETTGFGG